MTSSSVNALLWRSGAVSFRVVHCNNSSMSGANHPGSPPTIHQCLEDEACRVLAAVVGLSQSVMACASSRRRGRGRALRRTQQAGLQPLLWQDNERIYLLRGQDFRACVSILPCCPLTVFSVKYLQGKARFYHGWVNEEGKYKYCFVIVKIAGLGQFVNRHSF